ncbi:hypothetical protein [Hyalangium sp.]|uniref:hypothetical protein n=1 Tax=Hyalangium sp. TaxID=2028555 RepID=UPI002D5FCC4E|nr:hypothetical protein [Hyalangium sp.]HYH94585.1 hypothetical protein [Hyalangium sp.]
MSLRNEQPQKDEAVEALGCDPAVLFESIWGALVDLLGSAATATLIRRSLKRAAARVPELDGISINRERFEYRYVLPPGWKDNATEALDGLREVARELHPLLLELTGSVVLHRLRGIPDLERCRVFPSENES